MRLGENSSGNLSKHLLHVLYHSVALLDKRINLQDFLADQHQGPYNMHYVAKPE